MKQFLDIISFLIIGGLMYGSFLLGTGYNKGETLAVQKKLKKIMPKSKGSVYVPSEIREYNLEQERKREDDRLLEKDKRKMYGIKK